MPRRYHRRNSQTSTTKWCPAHAGGKGARVPTSEFYLDAGQSGGLTGICKECRRASRRAKYSRSSPMERRRIRYQTLRAACKREGVAFDLTYQDFETIISQSCEMHWRRCLLR